MNEGGKSQKSKRVLPFLVGGIIAVPIFLSYTGFPQFTAVSYDATPTSTPRQIATTTEEKKPEFTSNAAHLATPAAVKGIYMSQCVVGTPSFRTNLVKLVDETELNTIVIDIKDYTGKISFNTDNPVLKDSVSDACGARDMESFIKLLHDKNIYVIGRITVFQDPFYAKVHPDLAVHTVSDHEAVWHDRKGLAFIDVGAKPYWDFVVALSKESYSLGFDELNYDYIRFPSDGPMAEAYYSWSQGLSKPEAVERFWKYLYDNVHPIGVVMSADLFGMVTTNTDDLNIGQQLERAFPYFDYIDPMVYPSHYPPNFNGWKNPNALPYELIQFTMGAAVKRAIASTTPIQTFGSTPVMKTTVVAGSSTTATSTKEVQTGLYTKPMWDKQKLRPWLQDFSLGTPAYGATEVRDQIRATYDVGLTSWLLWSASNKYTKQALEAE